MTDRRNPAGYIEDGVQSPVRVVVGHLYSEMNRSQRFIKCLSKGGHHFSACQIMITDVSVGSGAKSSFDNRPLTSDF
jgi:hypothetical protein